MDSGGASQSWENADLYEKVERADLERAVTRAAPCILERSGRIKPIRLLLFSQYFLNNHADIAIAKLP